MKNPSHKFVVNGKLAEETNDENKCSDVNNDKAPDRNDEILHMLKSENKNELVCPLIHTQKSLVHT